MTNRYTGIPLEIVQNVVSDGFQLVFLQEQTEDGLCAKMGDIDYILAGGRTKITEKALQYASRLKMIQRTGVGLDSLDLEAIRKKGIPLYVNQGINAESVAEHALLLMLASLRRLNLIDRSTKAGVWNKQGQGVQTHELSGKTIGLIGMGNIAQTLVRLLDGFHVNILYSNLFRMPADFEEQHNMTFGTINEVFEKSDVISLHCALTEETTDLINGQSISGMKDGVVIINTARGPMVNADDLAAALISGKVAYAGIDVHDEEPIRNDYPLKQLDNVILTPHIAGVTYESFRKMMRDAMRNIELFDQGDLEAIQQYRYL